MTSRAGAVKFLCWLVLLQLEKVDLRGPGVWDGRQKSVLQGERANGDRIRWPPRAAVGVDVDVQGSSLAKMRPTSHFMQRSCQSRMPLTVLAPRGASHPGQKGCAIVVAVCAWCLVNFAPPLYEERLDL